MFLRRKYESIKDNAAKPATKVNDHSSLYSANKSYGSAASSQGLYKQPERQSVFAAPETSVDAQIIAAQIKNINTEIEKLKQRIEKVKSFGFDSEDLDKKLKSKQEELQRLEQQSNVSYSAGRRFV